MREIRKIVCSCGGTVKEQDTTPMEESLYGCQQKGCCVKAYVCEGCKTRFVFALEAPEYNYD